MGRVSLFTLLLVHIWLLGVFQAQARRRNLTEITYRFTNCGSTNHDGPRVEDRCRPLYEEMKSPIAAKPTTLFRLEDDIYDGAQGFHIPRDDLYNITVGGARGGEGVCNFHYGRGGVLSAQIRLTTDYEYLILVGHRGSSVCDVPENADHPLCLFPRPTNLTEAQSCNQSWCDWTQTLNTSIQRNVYNFNGGGGGGGASMVWPRRADSREFTDLPILIAPGGGGASAVLDYNGLVGAIKKISFGYPNTTVAERIYKFHVDAHFHQYRLTWPVGARGFRLSGDFQITSGSGSGWTSAASLPQLLTVDGKLLSQESNFAEGGFDCSSSLTSFASHVFTNVFGGYGGGGGGCGSGGGGGGYTGGHVNTNFNYISGSGGDAGLFNHTQFPIVGGSVSNNFNDADGFVEIVPSNCGCAGQCVVYTNESQFECLCPNDTMLADDRSSCYRELDVSISEEEPLIFIDSRETFYINGLQFVDTSFFMFGLDVSLTVSPKPGSTFPNQDVACAVVFVGRDFQSVVASNPVRIGTGRAYEVTILDDIPEGFGPSTDYVSFLEYPILVTGALLLTNGECSLSSPQLRVNISSESDESLTQDFSIIDQFEDSQVAISARLILGEEPPTTTAPTTPPPTEVTNTGLIVGLVILAIILIIAIVGIVLLLLYLRLTLGRKRSATLTSSGISGVNLVDNDLPAALSVHYETVKDGEGAVEIDKATGNEYATVNIKEGASIINPYATLTGDGKAYDAPLSLTNDSFTPRYGIVAPAVDFTMYNRERTQSSVSTWDYPRSNLVYLRELGEGQFGKVLLMKAKDIAGYKGKIPVAVKTLTSREPEVIQKFMEEAELMKKFSHPNIVSLLGISEAESDGDIDEDSSPLMILEYMPYGDLQSFLTSHQPDEKGQTSINQQHFVQFSIDIARALDFLSMNRYVHRDIAARNCLVGPNLHIKIADFGLSRGVYDKDYYKIAGKAVLPVRWMAPESLIFGMFSVASDAWSYGVTIWEITSYGGTPLEELEVQQIVNAAQKKTLQHSRPQHCSDILYEVMCKCHQHDAKQRPTFEEILTTLIQQN